MLDFLRRIPELLGLKRSAAGKPPGTLRQAAANDQNGSTGKSPRGRGTGRGTTPKGGRKPAGPATARKK